VAYADAVLGEARFSIASCSAGDVVDLASTNATLNRVTRAIFIGGAGNLSVEMEQQPGVTLTLTGVLAGSWIPIRVKKFIKATTTCTIIVAFY
jgi:hypothetical protein